MFTNVEIKPERPLNVPGAKMLLRSQAWSCEWYKPRRSRPMPPTMQQTMPSAKLLFKPHKVNYILEKEQEPRGK